MHGGKRAGAGRKPVNVDLVELEKLCGLQCTDEDLAGFLGVSVRTIERRCRRDATDAEAVSRLLRQCQPFLMVTDPPYGMELDSEWRDRAGLNGCGSAEPSDSIVHSKGDRL